MNTYEVWKRRTIGILKTQRVSCSGIQHIPKSGAAVLAPNHLNWKDVFFLAAMVPRQVHYVATYELFDTRRCYEYSVDYIMQKVGHWFKIPANFIGRNLAGIISHRVRAVGAIPVKRGGSTKEMFEAVEDGLKNGQVVCVFPEGGTGVVGTLKKFKKGLAKIVYDLMEQGYGRIPVLPAAIKGTNRCLFPCRLLSLHFGPSLNIEDHLKETPRETLNRFTEQLWEAVYSLLFTESKTFQNSKQIVNREVHERHELV